MATSSIPRRRPRPPVTLIGTFRDPGADSHTHLWQVADSTGRLVAQSNSQTFTFTPLDVSIFTAMYTVTDDDGGVGRDSALVSADFNLAPLKVSGALRYNPVEDRVEGTGVISIGLQPTGTTAFTPLIRVSGPLSLWYNDRVIHGQGVVTAAVGGVAAPLFDGTFEVPVGTAATSFLTEATPPPNQYQLAGTDIRFSRLELINQNPISPEDARIELQGVVTLPEDMGRIDLPIEVLPGVIGAVLAGQPTQRPGLGSPGRCDKQSVQKPSHLQP